MKNATGEPMMMKLTIIYRAVSIGGKAIGIEKDIYRKQQGDGDGIERHVPAGPDVGQVAAEWQPSISCEGVQLPRCRRDLIDDAKQHQHKHQRSQSRRTAIGLSDILEDLDVWLICYGEEIVDAGAFDSHDRCNALVSLSFEDKLEANLLITIRNENA